MYYSNPVSHNLFFSFKSLAVLAVFLPFATIGADEVTYDVSFTADTFQVGSGFDSPPQDPVVGSFTITFDPTLTYANTTAGITLNSLNISLGSPLSFSYEPTAGSFPGEALRVGGFNAGSDVIIFDPSTDDFWLYIYDINGAASFQQLGYTQTSVSSDNLFFTLNQTGSVTVSNAVPEPTGICIISMMSILGLTVRRRR